MKRLAGFDLNGWRDLAVRNWIQKPGEDDEVGPDTIISGGIDGCVVSLIEDENQDTSAALRPSSPPTEKGMGGVK